MKKLLNQLQHHLNAWHLLSGWRSVLFYVEFGLRGFSNAIRIKVFKQVSQLSIAQ